MTSNSSYDPKYARVRSIALGEACKYGIGGLIISGTSIAIASFASPNFSKFASVSAKSSIPLMIAIGIFSYKYETVSHQAMRDPDTWGVTEFLELGASSYVPFHHRLFNYSCDHPVSFAGLCSVPFLSMITVQQLSLPPSMQFKERMLHCKPLAISTVMAVSLMSLGFQFIKLNQGKYPEK